MRQEFLQMGYVFVVESGNFSVATNKNLWLYVILALPLVCLTMGIFLIRERLHSKKVLRQVDISSRV